MGLPLLAKVGEERELTEEISIYDILDILDFAELGKDVADLTTEYLKAAFLAYAKTIAKVSNVVVGISIAAYVLEAILIGLQRNGKTALEVTYTYRYDCCMVIPPLYRVGRLLALAIGLSNFELSGLCDSRKRPLVGSIGF